jgi:hypothetical protein
MERVPSNRIRLSLVVLLIQIVCPRIRAQQTQIDTLAAQMAASLSHASQKTVLVFDFVGPDGMDALGQKLAGDFRAALAKSPNGIQVEDYLRILELLKKNELVLANLHDAATARWLVGQTEVDAWIYGTLSNGIGGLKITIDAYPVKNSDRYFEFDTSVPLTDALKALIEEEEKDDFSSLPRAGQNGYTNPACIHCPSFQYTAEGLRRKLNGTVVLEITIRYRWTREGHQR